MCRNDLRAFSSQFPIAGLLEIGRAMFGDGERVWVGDDDGRIVANLATVPFEVTVAGGARLASAGVTWVAVSPTHRRRGLMRSAMDLALDDARGRGEALALLYASESSIYSHVGFGIGTLERRVHIDTRSARLRDGVASSTQLRFLDVSGDLDGVAGELIPIFERHRGECVGELTREASYWHRLLRPPAEPDASLSDPYVVVHPDGYVIYRTTERWELGRPGHTVEVEDLVAVTQDAHRALWGFLLELDLVAEVRMCPFPVEDPLPMLLDDPRSVSTVAIDDGLWARVLDTAAAFGARRYGARDELVIEVVDGGPGVEGRWHLEGGPDFAAVAPSRAEPDLSCRSVGLASLVLGGVAVSTLVRSGRLEERRPGVAARAEAMFRVGPAPLCTRRF